MRNHNCFFCFMLITIVISGYTSDANSAPQITGIDRVDQVIQISGNNYGVKEKAAPIYWNNFEGDTVGSLPTGFTQNGTPTIGLISSTGPTRGTKAINFSFDGNNAPHWARDYIDLGVGGVDNLYISSWMHYDKTGTTCTQWQLKSIVYGSYPASYGYFTTAPNQTTVGLEPWWRDSDNRWFNNFAYTYYNGMTLGASAALAADAFPWNQWHRIEMYSQRSSAPVKADGKMFLNRIDRATPIVKVDSAITHDDDDDKWRIVGIGQGVTTNFTTNPGRIKLTVVYDDLYIDNTQARVELCDSMTWSARKHCEIQPPTSWSDTKIAINLNSGSFEIGQSCFFYVIDSNGFVNSDGFKFTIPGPPPDLPKGVTVTPAAPPAN